MIARQALAARCHVEARGKSLDSKMERQGGTYEPSTCRLMALPRYGSGDEIASLVAYLTSPEAGYLTGASLTIDGGFTA